MHLIHNHALTNKEEFVHLDLYAQVKTVVVDKQQDDEKSKRNEEKDEEDKKKQGPNAVMLRLLISSHNTVHFYNFNFIILLKQACDQSDDKNSK